MKRATTGLIALAAIVGITSAFTTKTKAKFDTSRKYGVISKFTVGSVRHYNVELFDLGVGCAATPVATCSGFFTSLNTVATVVTTALGSKAQGTFQF